MESRTKQAIIVSLVGLIIVGGVIYLLKKDAAVNNAPGPLDSLAQCIKDKGATFYGAFWCPHCKAQKETFGNSARLLPYVECSTPDGNSEVALCNDKKVESYPTWIFPNPIKFIESSKPLVCSKAPGLPGEDPACNSINRSSYATLWIFPKFQISSESQPVHTGDTWIFDQTNSQLRGEISLDELANQTGCTVPK